MMASTSRATENEAIEADDTKERLHTAFHYAVGQMCEEIGTKKNVTFSKAVIGAISNLALNQTQIIASDLEQFAKHAKRSTITDDDVKLLVRRNKDLSDHIKTLSRQLSTEAAAKTAKHRKRARIDEDVNDEI